MLLLLLLQLLRQLLLLRLSLRRLLLLQRALLTLLLRLLFLIHSAGEMRAYHDPYRDMVELH